MTKTFLLGICLLAGVPVVGAPLSISSVIDVPGTVYVAPDGLSGVASVGAFTTGAFEVLGTLGDDRVLDAAISTLAYGEAYFDKFGLMPRGIVSVDLFWSSVPLVVLGGSGDGLAYFGATCLGTSAYCGSNLDLANGMLAFTFGVPFHVEIWSSTVADFVTAENVTVGANVYVDTTWARITGLYGNELTGAVLMRAPLLGPAETPEPSSLALTALGLAACAWLRARSRA